MTPRSVVRVTFQISSDGKHPRLAMMETFQISSERERAFLEAEMSVF